MNQADLIHNTAGISGESKKATEAVLKAATDVIAATLKAGEEVTLPGLGKLHVLVSKPRNGRNPKTGETLAIPAKRTVKFKPGKALLELGEGRIDRGQVFLGETDLRAHDGVLV